jgi:putative SOS response-associated peptidase YedK
MPVILDPRHYDLWMDHWDLDPVRLMGALLPGAAGTLTARPVSPWVNNPRHEGLCCLEPAA